MKYKVGDKVLVKSLSWYNKHKDRYGNVHGTWLFTEGMSQYCEKMYTIGQVFADSYEFTEIELNRFTDDMIEGKIPDDFYTTVTSEICHNAEVTLSEISSQDHFHIEDGYEFDPDRSDLAKGDIYIRKKIKK